jgi:hypothetical protein
MTKSIQENSFQKISVIVPQNPFTPRQLNTLHPCLCVLDVSKLMDWWPGKPHSPHRDAAKVKAIQWSLDWKCVAQIAAYLLQKEIIDASDKLNKYFTINYLLPVSIRRTSTDVPDKRRQKRANLALLIFYLAVIAALLASVFAK